MLRRTLDLPETKEVSIRKSSGYVRMKTLVDILRTGARTWC